MMNEAPQRLLKRGEVMALMGRYGVSSYEVGQVMESGVLKPVKAWRPGMRKRYRMDQVLECFGVDTPRPADAGHPSQEGIGRGLNGK